MALVLVLCLLVVLGSLATDVAREARLEASIVTSLHSRTAARYAAESGVIAAIVRLDRLLDSLPSPTERAAELRDLGPRLSLSDITLGNAQFGVTISDLNARLDLNQADVEALRGLFRQFTTDRQAEIIAAGIKARPLTRVGELGAVAGVTDALALAVAPYVTVWGDATVNINTAPEPVLAALPGVGQVEARALMTRRASGEVFTPTYASPSQKSSRGARIVFAAAPPAAVVVTEPSRLLIIARGWQQGSPLTHEIQAVYAIAHARLVLQSWQERDL